jgi:hypothetical protein
VTASSQGTPLLPAAIYVWIVPSEDMLDQPGSWRIRKWDTEPFPEANFTLSSASETTAGSEPGLTVQGYRFPASLVRGLTPFGEQQAVNEAAWELVRRKADTNMNRCQELAQAAVAAYRASVERQLNPMEQSATLAGSDPATDALDAICKMLGCTTWEYPGQVVRDVKMAVDAMREVLKCGEEGLMIDEHLHNRIERLIGRTDSEAVKR